MNSLIERVGRAEKLSPMQRFARNMPVIAEELGPSEPANDKGLAGSDGPGALPCGHHPSLFIKSVESDAQWCELCDMRSQRNDAVQMEHHYRERLEVAERALRDAETRGWNAALKEIAAGFHPERYRSVHVLAEELARPSQSPEEGQ
jgi:hypothetical protein